ncbi:rotatin [Bicyclus anynana]|uniref:Rotatin n=1 Tax=Bicyclus anynana TaxID=110368 RepID=A0A6J1NXQ9_BICAN|nr:rotatin [Bicyclus anynana]XP_052737797.1 rotatin [Bicyclus anynana]
MNFVEVSSAYIKKLNHPMREIRERSLQLLLNKLQLGWGLEDELAGTRELLEALLAWFNVQKPTYQREALELLLNTLKTKAGTYIAKEIGTEKILLTLNKIRPKISIDATEVFDDLIETLRFLHTIDSEVNLGVPPLNLNSHRSSDSNGSSGYYNLGLNKGSSKESSIYNEDIKIKSPHSGNGINVLLFPWVNLCSSDLKTLILIEDSLKVLKSTRRCCRFIRDVVLRDFPTEIFLNRPTIIKILLAIADGQCRGHPVEALNVILSITHTLQTRLLKLLSLDLISQSNKQSVEQTGSIDNVNMELEHIAGESRVLPADDALIALRQMPAPIYALDALHTVLAIMIRHTVLETLEDNEVMDMNELNVSLCLIENLIELLLNCVSEKFWSSEHTSQVHRDIAHKACMVMRTLGELLTKYRLLSFNKEHERAYFRVAWLRLVPCGVTLLHWARSSALPPSPLITALQAALIDPAVELLYPTLGKRTATVLMKAKSSVDQEYKTKYRELNKLCVSMDNAVQFMKIKDSVSKDILVCIKHALPVLHLNVNQNFLNDIAKILLKKLKDLDLSDCDWSTARSIALILMSHSVDWVRVMFYEMLGDMVKSVLMSDEGEQAENEKCLTLLCDVGILTEICCHGLSSKLREVESSSSEIMLYLLRGRMVLSESCWWRLLASLLPVLPLLHVFAEHDTQLGKAICKSLEPDIIECMGVSRSDMIAGLVRLVFVNCATVKLDAVHSLCRLLDDTRYLPPRDSLRTDVIINALRRVDSQDFNIDQSSSPSKNTQTSGLAQILDVLKQDLVLDEESSEYVTQSRPSQPTLEPSLRRSTLQQVAVMMRQQELHETFIQYDGLNLIVSLLRLSLMVDDYLAFPECAISCVSVLNSVCFLSRHTLAKIYDLPLLLLRVILVFPANDNTVLMAAQVLSLTAWAGFALQELDANRRRVPALPYSVIHRTSLPFTVNSYWTTSPNTEHSTVEWLLSEELWRNAIRIRWWWVCGGGPKLLRSSRPSPVPPPPPNELDALRTAHLQYSCSKYLLALENATTHAQVNSALQFLESYTHLIQVSPTEAVDLGSLPWQHTKRFLVAPPASSRDTALLISLLQFIVAYMDNVPKEGNAMSWIKLFFIGNDATVLSLLSRDRLYPQQTAQENIELIQLRICIVKVLVRCILLLEHDAEYSCSKMESLLKILLTCLERIDLKNFHVLGYLNELIRCIRYAIYSRYCKLSEDSLIHSLKVMTYALNGCATGAGRKGQACRLDAMLSLLALLRQIRENSVPVQRWSEVWDGNVVRALVRCTTEDGAELRASALHVTAALTAYTQLMPQLLQCVPKESLVQHSLDIFSQEGEANVVRAAAASLLTSLTARTSPHTKVFEVEVLQALDEANFIEECMHIFIDFCNETTECKNYIEPNVPLSVLERRSELEVLVHKSGDMNLSPSLPSNKPPPTAALVAALADALHNVTAYKSAPVQSWNERGLYRVLFRCAAWTGGSVSEVCRVYASTCRALAASALVKCVRSSLAGTKDCLYNLIGSLTLTLVDEEEYSRDWLESRAPGLRLLSALLSERAASDVVWWELKRNSTLLDLLLHALASENQDLQKTAMHCITELTRSISHKRNNDEAKEEACDFLNSIKSSYSRRLTDKFSAGDKFDCQPEYMIEDICKILLDLYRRYMDTKKSLSSQDDKWTSVCACLCSVVSVSARARTYCVHRHFAGTLLQSLQTLRDTLSLQGKPVDVIRNADNEPILATLNWILTLSTCLMLECVPAKERIAEDLACSLIRLWPWCMITEQLRDTVLRLLVTFTNDCPKAWASMCSCVGSRSMLHEVCSLVDKEAARPRPAAFLPLALRVLRQCVAHHHCRTVIVKNEVLTCICKLRARAGHGSAAGEEWTKLCEAMARHSDGAAAVLATVALPAMKPTPARMLPALAHAAHHHRLTFLQSPDLLELLSGCLHTGDTAEVVSAARAVWALAANNHRAKLVLRSAGITSAVQSTMQRLQKHSHEEATQRALELLTYTRTVLQTT